jgi:hypothetical protein
MGLPHVRERAQNALITSTLGLFDHLKTDHDVRIFLLTFSPESGFTNTVAPVADAAALKLKARRLLSELQLQGICTIEFDVVANKLGDEDVRRLMHVHGIVWTRNPAFQSKIASREQSRRPGNINPLGMPSVLFQSRAMAKARANSNAAHWEPVHKHPERDQTARSMAWLAQYMLKSPSYAKNVYAGIDGRWRSRPDEGHFGLKMALRMYELWSHFHPENAVFSVGQEARQFHLEYRSLIRAAYGSHGQADQRKRDRVRWSNAWRSYFSHHHKLGLQPSTVIL